MRLARRSALASLAVLAVVVSLAAASSAATAPALPRLKVAMAFDYRVVGSVTRIRQIYMFGLPSTGREILRCLGKGCFSPGVHRPASEWAQIVKYVRRRTYRPGQKLVFIFYASGYHSVAFVLKMVYNDDPRLTVLPKEKKKKR